MFKAGDYVWVEATRNKRRLGKILTVHESVRKCRVKLGENIIQCKWDDLILSSELENKRMNDEAIKNDEQKARLELIPSSGIDAAGRAMTYGANKYADHNWANGFDWDRLVGSMMRHLNAWRNGEDCDPESGLNHIDHICANAMMLAAHVHEELGNDNRRKTKN